MFDIIAACTTDYGIGFLGKIPWNIPEELKIFKSKTQNSILIMGRKTVETLPKLENRIVICLSQNSNIINNDNNNSIICKSIEDVLKLCKERFPEKKIFIAGGEQIYKLVFEKYFHLINMIHFSIVKETYICDTFFPKDENNLFCALITINNEEFTHYTMYKYEYCETMYLKLLSKVLISGDIRNTRNGETKSIFGENLKFNLLYGFPLLTSKKMFFRGIVEELLFFIKGETDSKILENKNINIWKGNTKRDFLDTNGFEERKEGIMGPLYGYQWRYFNADYDEKNAKPLEKGIDQLKEVIELIKNNPTSRRILLTSYNPEQSKKGVLYPCHSIIIQFYVHENYLDMFCYNRSQDLFLGVPFNIASSALLLILIAKITDLTPRFLNISMGDVHIYKQHYELAKCQIIRKCYQFPELKINKNITSLEDVEKLNFEDFILENYSFEPPFKTEMVA